MKCMQRWCGLYSFALQPFTCLKRLINGAISYVAGNIIPFIETVKKCVESRDTANHNNIWRFLKCTQVFRIFWGAHSFRFECKTENTTHTSITLYILCCYCIRATHFEKQKKTPTCDLKSQHQCDEMIMRLFGNIVVLASCSFVHSLHSFDRIM